MSMTAAVPKARPAARRVTTTSRVARPAPTRAPARPRQATSPLGRPALRLVDTTAVQRRRRVRVGLWLGILVVTASLVAVVAFRVVVAQGQLAIDRIEQASLAQQQRYQQLRLELAQRSSPAAIVGRASAMGMVEATGAPTVVSVPTDPATTPPPSDGATSPTAGWETVKPHIGR